MADDVGKVTERLRGSLEAAGETELVELVIELEPQTAASEEGGPRERIAAMKRAFEHQSAPVVQILRDQGAEVRDLAWINQTISARVPKTSIGRLSELESVTRIDSPRTLERELSSRSSG